MSPSDKHSTVSMPPDLEAAVRLGKHERAHVAQLCGKRKVTSVCGGVACAAQGRVFDEAAKAGSK